MVSTNENAKDSLPNSLRRHSQEGQPPKRFNFSWIGGIASRIRNALHHGSEEEIQSIERQSQTAMRESISRLRRRSESAYDRSRVESVASADASMQSIGSEGSLAGLGHDASVHGSLGSPANSYEGSYEGTPHGSPEGDSSEASVEENFERSPEDNLEASIDDSRAGSPAADSREGSYSGGPSDIEDDEDGNSFASEDIEHADIAEDDTHQPAAEPGLAETDTAAVAELMDEDMEDLDADLDDVEDEDLDYEMDIEMAEDFGAGASVGDLVAPYAQGIRPLESELAFDDYQYDHEEHSPDESSQPAAVPVVENLLEDEHLETAHKAATHASNPSDDAATAWNPTPVPEQHASFMPSHEHSHNPTQSRLELGLCSPSSAGAPEGTLNGEAQPDETSGERNDTPKDASTDAPEGGYMPPGTAPGSHAANAKSDVAEKGAPTRGSSMQYTQRYLGFTFGPGALDEPSNASDGNEDIGSRKTEPRQAAPTEHTAVPPDLDESETGLASQTEPNTERAPSQPGDKLSLANGSTSQDGDHDISNDNNSISAYCYDTNINTPHNSNDYDHEHDRNDYKSPPKSGDHPQYQSKPSTWNLFQVGFTVAPAAGATRLSDKQLESAEPAGPAGPADHAETIDVDEEFNILAQTAHSLLSSSALFGGSPARTPRPRRSSVPSLVPQDDPETEATKAAHTAQLLFAASPLFGGAKKRSIEEVYAGEGPTKSGSSSSPQPEPASKRAPEQRRSSGRAPPSTDAASQPQEPASPQPPAAQPRKERKIPERRRPMTRTMLRALENEKAKLAQLDSAPQEDAVEKKADTPPRKRRARKR